MEFAKFAFALPGWFAAMLCVGLVPSGLAATSPPVQIPGTTAQSILTALPSTLLQRLQQNKVVILLEADQGGLSSEEQMVGFVIFEAEKERVYRFLSQTTRQIEYRPEITSIETLNWNVDGPVDRHQIKIVFNRFVYHLRWHLDPKGRTLWWELDDSQRNDLDRVYGSWELFDLEEGGTLGRFSASVDVGNAVPKFLQDYITRRNLPKTMDSNRRWVDSGGTYRP